MRDHQYGTDASLVARWLPSFRWNPLRLYVQKYVQPELIQPAGYMTRWSTLHPHDSQQGPCGLTCRAGVGLESLNVRPTRRSVMKSSAGSDRITCRCPLWWAAARQHLIRRITYWRRYIQRVPHHLMLPLSLILHSSHVCKTVPLKLYEYLDKNAFYNYAEQLIRFSLNSWIAVQERVILLTIRKHIVENIWYWIWGYFVPHARTFKVSWMHNRTVIILPSW